MKFDEIADKVGDVIDGKTTYAAAILAGIYWAGAGKGWWPRDPFIDSAAGIAVVSALRRGSKRDAKKAVIEIKSDAADIAQKQEGPTP